MMTDLREVEHALKNHLGIVLGFSQLLLLESAPDDPRRAELAEIYKAATAAVQIMSAGLPQGRDDATPPAPVEARPDGLDAVERDHIVRVLADVQGNKLAAARRLGISRRTLYRRLERHGLLEPAGPNSASRSDAVPTPRAAR